MISSPQERRQIFGYIRAHIAAVSLDLDHSCNRSLEPSLPTKNHYWPVKRASEQKAQSKTAVFVYIYYRQPQYQLGQPNFKLLVTLGKHCGRSQLAHSGCPAR